MGYYITKTCKGNMLCSLSGCIVECWETHYECVRIVTE